MAGIVDGVLQVNHELARYEAAVGAWSPCASAARVRRALRRAGQPRGGRLAVVADGSPVERGLRDLRTVTVARRPVACRWARRSPNRPAVATVPDHESPTMRPTWTIARWRSTSPYSAAMHAPTACSTASTGDGRQPCRASAPTRTTCDGGTLYDQLIPQRSRAIRDHGGRAVHRRPRHRELPWELLGCPARTRRSVRVRPAMRQFTEPEDRRLNPSRASFGDALVIAAGNVPGETSCRACSRRPTSCRALGTPSPGTSAARRPSPRSTSSRCRTSCSATTRSCTSPATASTRRIVPADRGNPVVRPLLTVDPVRQLRFVPDVVFLNCCSLGRTGMNRLAAGLAREFMAIGTRAVSPPDGRSTTPRRSVRRDLLHRADRGPAARRHGHRARITCADPGGGETWAAYQCYGDPGFVVRGHRPT